MDSKMNYQCCEKMTISSLSISLLECFNNDELDSLVIEHSELLFKLYKTNMLFYKVIFKANKFNLAALIMSLSFTNESPSLSDVIDRFTPLNQMSKNSISNFFSLLVFTGRLKTYRNEEDARKVNFRTTDKLNNEAYQLINTMVAPITHKLQIKIPDLNVEIYLKHFFDNFSKVVLENKFNFHSLPDVDIFINRDGGHAIILALYCSKKMKEPGKYQTPNVKEIARWSGVSRSHILGVLKDMKSTGFADCGDIESEIILTDKFVKFTRDYFRLFFSFCIIGMKTFIEQSSE